MTLVLSALIRKPTFLASVSKLLVMSCNKALVSDNDNATLSAKSRSVSLVWFFQEIAEFGPFIAFHIIKSRHQVFACSILYFPGPCHLTRKSKENRPVGYSPHEKLKYTIKISAREILIDGGINNTIAKSYCKYKWFLATCLKGFVGLYIREILIPWIQVWDRHQKPMWTIQFWIRRKLTDSGNRNYLGQ